ncbi:hypothetical protein JTB14_015771 [Gonioctena quinquepunctata]|nr:hypothetical protein JTB14_015771 [Gonioctena quinquepunctata]
MARRKKDEKPNNFSLVGINSQDVVVSRHMWNASSNLLLLQTYDLSGTSFIVGMAPAEMGNAHVRRRPRFRWKTAKILSACPILLS